MKHPSSNQSGATMVITLMVLSVLTTYVLCAINYTSQVAAHVERTNTFRNALNLADGSLELSFAYWRETSRLRSNVARPGQDYAALPLPTAAMYASVPNFTASASANPATGTPYTISNFKIVGVDPQLQDCLQTAEPPAGTGMELGTKSTFYLANADVSLPARGRAGPVSVKLRRVFERQTISPWNYAIFYIDHLEIHPGPQFNITGRVHSNAKVYTAHNTLSFGSAMTYGDDWSIGFMPGDGSHSSETPQAPSYPSNQPPTREQGQQPYGLDSTRVFSTTDTNPNNDSYQEIVEQRNPAYSDPFTDLTDPSNPRLTRYYDQADLKILIGAGGALTLKDRNDYVLTNKVTDTLTQKALYSMAVAAYGGQQVIQDNREAAQVTLNTIDMSKINAAVTTGITGFQGVIYISDTTSASAPSNQRRAVRLKNGAVIPTGGITIASNNPVYIQGDYNTGIGTIPSNLTGSSNDPTRPTTSTYTRRSCAVIGDAVMFLSNNWNDSKASSDVSLRTATPTTVNSAVVSGIVPTATSGTNYSGGAENFPRFMENWNSTVTMTYYGSMVELYKSKQNVGTWGKSNVYSAPVRNWFFDTQFYTTPPPGTLTLVLYKKGRWYVQ